MSPRSDRSTGRSRNSAMPRQYPTLVQLRPCRMIGHRRRKACIEVGKTRVASRYAPSLVRRASQELKSGRQPLSDILDLAKAAELDGAALSTLWTTYHQDKGFLSASIPLDTYEQMLRTARQYPMFVLPLARQIEGNDKAAVEMHLIV